MGSRVRAGDGRSSCEGAGPPSQGRECLVLAVVDGLATRSIHERGIDAFDRSKPGHWEGDLIVGTQDRSAIGTLVERVSRFTLLVHLPARQTAGTITAGVVGALRRRPAPCAYRWPGIAGRRWPSMTRSPRRPASASTSATPGAVGSGHRLRTPKCMLPQYFPKGTDLAILMPADSRRVAKELNSHPRKSPEEAPSRRSSPNSVHS